MEEETYYSDGTNWVTNRRLIFDSRQYPLDHITHVEMKPIYPQKIVLLRLATIMIAAFLFLLVLLYGSSFIETVSALSGLSLPLSYAVFSILMLGALIREIYRKRPHGLSLFVYAVLALLLTLFLIYSAIVSVSEARTSPLVSAGLVLIVLGSYKVLSLLDRQSTFAIRISEPGGTVDIYITDNRLLAHMITGYIKQALVKRPKPQPADQHKGARLT
ncbi:MAG: DUF6232 family protein [Chloroflexota bacterium]